MRYLLALLLIQVLLWVGTLLSVPHPYHALISGVCAGFFLASTRGQP